MKQILFFLFFIMLLPVLAQTQTVGVTTTAGLTPGTLVPGFTYFNGPFTLPASATAGQLCIRSDSDTGMVVMGIASDNAGKPGITLISSANEPLSGAVATMEDKCQSIPPTFLTAGVYWILVVPSTTVDVLSMTASGQGAIAGCSSCNFHGTLPLNGSSSVISNMLFEAYVTTGTPIPTPTPVPPAPAPTPIPASTLGPNLFQIGGNSIASTVTVTLGGVTISPDPWQGPRGQEILMMQDLGALAASDPAVFAVLAKYHITVTDGNSVVIFPKPQ